MTPERWQQIKNLVNSALEQDAEQRSAVLQQSCASDLPLRRGAEALLSFHEQATRNLANVPVKLNSNVPLSPEQWERIEQLFQSAMEIDPAKRAAFLAEVCGADEQVRHEVESLLVYQAAAGDLIGGAIQQAAGLLNNGAAEKARFTPGTTLNKRYRIIGLLGKGGMGEVYRADDLKLGQPVALKFLTEKLSQDKAMLARFHSEVAMAHRVTHPNVCRVHDIGDVTTSSGNLHFLSMEYVDGEDLSSLLRRIGRLPADKAVEIATQLCAGLAAAHEAGVLHRDLKPANVMLDGKGRVRITDFGLAGIAEQIRGQEVFAGTPAYMSPEQFAGKEVTTKSDIYALGLVLYEIFTGKRVFEAGSLDELRRLHESSSPTNPSNWVKDIDPLVERVILRCLEKDPGRRLASAKQVADALPGGDPLAAALAMGETPSPEVVAAAGSQAGMKPMYAVACLVAIIVCWLAFPFLNRRVNLIERMPVDNSPEVLARKVREVHVRLGWAEPPLDTAHGILTNNSAFEQYKKNASRPEDWDKLVSKDRTPFLFWYRETQDYMIAGQYSEDYPRVTPADPPLRGGGMSYLTLSLSGRLEYFEAIPELMDTSAEQTATPDWNIVFSLAGLDFSQFKSATQIRIPRTAYDVRGAWTGPHPRQPGVQLHVEAAAYRGRVVSFYTTEAERMGALLEQQKRRFQPSVAQRAGNLILIAIVLIALLGAAWLTRRNLRLQKGDRVGAYRMAAFIFLCTLSEYILKGHHSPSPSEVGLFFQMMAMALLRSGFGYLFYLSLEPWVRRRWPETLIGWQRLLTGSWRDPVVGRDVLVGLAAGAVLYFVSALAITVAVRQGVHPNLTWQLQEMTGFRYAAGLLMGMVSSSIYIAAGLFFIIFMTCVILRREWLAAVTLTLILAALSGLTSFWPLKISLLYAVVAGILHFMIARYWGLLALALMSFSDIITMVPLTTRFSAWYASNAYLVLTAILALAIWAFHTSLGGQKVFAGKLLEE